MEEIHPAGLVLLHSFGGAQTLAVSIFIDRNRDQNRYIFILAAPVAAQIDAIHIDMRVASTLPGAVSKEIPLRRGTLRFTSPEVVVRFRL